jgi:hypothetical protein
MREPSPYRESGEKLAELSHEERVRIIDSMMSERDARATERARTHLGRIQIASKLSLGVTLVVVALLVAANEPRLVRALAIVSVLGIMSVIAVRLHVRPR